MHCYSHTVKYYETDRIGFTHHSNYIRWMEEARIDFMDQLGWSYQRFEDEGLISPVTAVECKYKKTTTFPETVTIEVSVEEFRSIKLRIKYLMKNEHGDVVCEGASEHCFLNKEGKLVRIDKEFPEFAELLVSDSAAARQNLNSQNIR